MYSKAAIDHFLKPRHAGALAGPGVASGQATNADCGDIATFFVTAADGRLQVAFQCQGCAGAVAACSVAAQSLAGQPVATAQAPEAAELQAVLAPWPPAKLGCTAMAAAALAQALSAWRASQPGAQ